MRWVNDVATVESETALARAAAGRVRSAALVGPFEHAHDQRLRMVPIVSLSGDDARVVWEVHREQGDDIDVQWRWSTVWIGHEPRDAWVRLVMRYPTIGSEFDVGFNGEFDRRLLRAVYDARCVAWTAEPTIGARTFSRAISVEMDVEDDVGEMLRLIELRKRHGARERPLRCVRPRTTRRRSERPRGPGGRRR